ncbi:MAG: FAD-dependent oxidoreductase [Akkermansiaceae bacterium]
MASAAGTFPSHATDHPTHFLTPEDQNYDKHRSLFNSDLSLKPALIAPCSTQADVQNAVRHANEKDFPIAIKSGGHCFIGTSVNNGGMTLNLRTLAQKVYLPKDQRLIAGPGVKLGELYNLLLPHGRLLPAGSCSGVGLGGLTLGGGYGLFARQYGLTCDHLERVKMVDGTGNVIDSHDDPDLLWACRGGGNGNFGVVTSMEFRTQKAPKKLGTQRLTARNLNAQKMSAFVEAWFSIIADLAEPIFSALVLNGSQITVLLTSSYATSGPSFQRTVNALLKAGFSTRGALNTPIAKALKRYYGRPGPLPFYNVSGGYFEGSKSLSHCRDEIIAKVLQNSGLIFQVNTLGGAIARAADSAYAHRRFPYLGEVQAYWQRDSQRDNLIQQVKEIQTLINAPAHYRNYPDAELPNFASSYYGEKLPRLQELKHRYDPHNRFRHQQSISAL